CVEYQNPTTGLLSQRLYHVASSGFELLRQLFVFVKIQQRGLGERGQCSIQFACGRDVEGHVALLLHVENPGSLNSEAALAETTAADNYLRLHDPERLVVAARELVAQLP